jgi:hypothetical protein
MTLNAFHFSGISSIGIASGVPRVEEILNASKKQKSYSMTLYIKNQEDVRTMRRKLYSSIIEVYLSCVVTNTTVEYISSLEQFSEIDQQWYQLFFMLYGNEILDEDTKQLYFPWRIRLDINRQKMYHHSLTCLQIANRIQDTFRDIYCVASPDNIGIIDIYIDFSNMKLKKKEEEDIATIPYKDYLCIQHIILPMLNDILLSGIEGIDQMFMREEKGEWVIDTQGSNLSSMFKYDFLDHTRSHSSDIWEVYKTFGIEATRQFIINEFYKVLSSSGASVGRRHIELLADSMTFQGKIASVNRYGIDRNETGPLAKASFEESVSNFFIAAANGEKDEMGVSSSVMAGKLAQFGTGYVDVIPVEKQSPFPIPDPMKELMMKSVSSSNSHSNSNSFNKFQPVSQDKPKPISLAKAASLIQPSMKAFSSVVGEVTERDTSIPMKMKTSSMSSTNSGGFALFQEEEMNPMFRLQNQSKSTQHAAVQYPQPIITASMSTTMSTQVQSQSLQSLQPKATNAPLSKPKKTKVEKVEKVEKVDKNEIQKETEEPEIQKVSWVKKKSIKVAFSADD